jgi:hypothetical protein
MYRDDDVARAERASSLIDEIAALERQKLSHAATDQRLELAKQELSALQANAPAAAEGRPGLVAHLLVFSATAGAAYLGYTLLV